ELAPAFAVGGLIGVLRDVAAGGVEEHRFFGEPPVAVARAADATDATPARALLEREPQPGVDERGRLARSRRAADPVPRQLVQALAPALLQRRDCAFEATRELRRIRRWLLLRGPAGTNRP